MKVWPRFLVLRLDDSLAELDPLDRTARRRVVARALAARSMRRKLGGLLAIGAAFLVVWFVALLGLVHWQAPDALDPDDLMTTEERLAQWQEPRLLVLVGISAGIGVAAALLLRRLVRRAGVRRALARRSLCGGCGYGLTGLRANESGALVCPECRLASHPIPELGELTEGVYRPRSDLAPARYWTARRVRRAGASVAGVAALAGLAWLAVVLVARWRFAEDQRAARTDLVELRVEFERLFPRSAQEGLPNVYAEIERICGAFDALDQTMRREEAAADPGWKEPSSSASGFVVFLRERPEDLSEDCREALPFVQRVVEQWEAAGGPTELLRLTRPMDYMLPLTLDEETGVQRPRPTLARVRAMYRLTQALEWRAEQTDDAEAWEGVARVQLALAGAARAGKTLIAELVSDAIEMGLLQRCAERLGAVRGGTAPERSADRWLEAAQRILEARCAESSVELFDLAGERVEVRFGIASAFANEASRDEGVLRDRLHGPFGDEARPIGRYTDVVRDSLVELDHLNMILADLQASHGLTEPPESALGTPNLVRWGREAYVREVRKLVQGRSALATMVALERHRRAQGTYPERLEDLALPIAGGQPLDVFARRGRMGYRPETIPATGQRTYILYSVGPDGVDNGGVCGGHETPLQPDARDGEDLVYFHVPIRPARPERDEGDAGALGDPSDNGADGPGRE